MSEDTEAPPQEDTKSDEAPAVKPLEVKITNPTKSDKAWNDSCDNEEYDEIILSKEDKDI